MRLNCLPERQAKQKWERSLFVQKKETVVEAIHRLTGGGADVSYKSLGSVVFRPTQLFIKLRDNMVVSIWERETDINPNEFAYSEKSLKELCLQSYLPKVLELMEQGYFSAESGYQEN